MFVILVIWMFVSLKPNSMCVFATVWGVSKIVCWWTYKMKSCCSLDCDLSLNHSHRDPKTPAPHRFPNMALQHGKSANSLFIYFSVDFLAIIVWIAIRLHFDFVSFWLVWFLLRALTSFMLPRILRDSAHAADSHIFRMYVVN